MDLVTEGLGVEHAVDGNVVLVDLGVLGMEVVDGTLKSSNGGNRVDALPDEVRGVNGRADGIAHRLTQAEQRCGVVNAEAGVHLKGDLGHAMLLGKCGGLFPIGDQNLVPLIVEDLAEIIGPGAGHPVGRLVGGRSTGTAREGHDGVNTQLLSQQHRVVEIVVIALGDRGIGMHRVAMAGKAGKRHVVTRKRVLELRELRVVRKQNLGVCMILAGIAAAADLDCLDPQLLKLDKCLF